MFQSSKSVSYTLVSLGLPLTTDIGNSIKHCLCFWECKGVAWDELRGYSRLNRKLLQPTFCDQHLEVEERLSIAVPRPGHKNVLVELSLSETNTAVQFYFLTTMVVLLIR